MSDYISKSSLFREFSNFVRASNNSDFEKPPTWNDAVSLVGSMPTIDAVEVKRCRDCKHRQSKVGDCDGNGVVLCKDGLWRDMEFFCADGERSEDE